ncbi:MAG: hypothetical protein AAFX81_15945 [Pseudomonadota bacterium]
MAGLTRRRDWLAALRAELAATEASPWSWGTHDCVALVARLAGAMCDGELAPALPDWSSQDEADAALAGAGGLVAAVTARLGPAYEAPALARRGDVVVTEAGRGMGLGIMTDGGRVVQATEPVGWVRLPRGSVVMAWPLGWALAVGT